MHGNAYTLRFAAAVSVVASVLVAATAMMLRDRQEANRRLDRQRNVLDVAALITPGERLTREEIDRRFARHIRPFAIDLATGLPATGIDPATFDQRAATRDPATSSAAPPNDAGLTRLPRYGVVYHVVGDEGIDALVLPVEGLGLWSTIYGFVALRADLRSVRGVAFYEHLETPGLGGEIDNPSWKARWVGRRVFDDTWTPRIQVIKGAVPSPERAPHDVDGLSGATLTGRGVTNLVRFWLGPDGWGPYLQRYRDERGPP